MGAKPKQSDYQATAAEKLNASVGKAEYDYFKSQYAPLLRQMRDETLADDSGQLLRGRANADTMQALSTSDYNSAQRASTSGDTSSALLGQYGVADASGKDIKDKKSTNVLGIARGQAADAQTGLSQASRLATSSALNRAKNRQDTAQAKMNAAVQIGSSAAKTGIKNKQSGGSFFSPGNMDQSLAATAGGTNPMASNSGVRADGSLGNRIKWGST